MADVGVRALKEHLSEYLDRAAHGELVLVTERGKPKAVLGPVPGRARIEEGVREGWISRGSGAPLRRVSRHRGSGRVLDALDEDRGR